MRTRHVCELFKQLAQRKVPAKPIYTVQRTLSPIQVNLGSLVENGVQELVFSCQVVRSVCDLDPGLAFVTAFHECLAHANARVEERLRVHAEGLGDRLGLQQRQALPVVLDAAVQLAMLEAAFILEAAVEGVAVVA